MKVKNSNHTESDSSELGMKPKCKKGDCSGAVFSYFLYQQQNNNEIN